MDHVSEKEKRPLHLASMHLGISAVGLASRKLLVREHDPKQKERLLFSLPQFMVLFEVATVS